MNRRAGSVWLLVMMVAFIVALQDAAHACPTCYGDPESSQTEGMNMAIMSLLGITGGVLAAIVGFFLFMRRRIQMLERRFVNRLN